MKGNKVVLKVSETTYFVVDENDITEGFLHDTYTDYGRKLYTEEASDYTVGINEFDEVLVEYLTNKYDILNQGSFYVNEMGLFDYDMEIDKSLLAEINRDIIDYIKRESVYTRATYINYFNGHNYQSLIIKSDYTAFDEELPIVEGELKDAILNGYEEADYVKDNQTYVFHETDRFAYTTPKYGGKPYYYECEEK